MGAVAEIVRISGYARSARGEALAALETGSGRLDFFKRVKAEFAACGIGPRETRLTALPDVFDVLAGWQSAPPTHWLAAAFLGHKPPAEPAQVMTPEAARDFMARTGGRIPGVGRM